MRLALLGDIHGNADALEAVLYAIEREQIDVLCLTGDFVGYYYEPHKALEMLSAWNTHMVRGNHEDMLIECAENEAAAADYRRRYGSGIDHALRMLSPAQLAFLKALPDALTFTCAGKRVLLAHGAPWDTNCYLYSNADPKLWARIGEADADYIILGHTHYPMLRRVGSTLVVNPGSVGQPRDRRPGAAWALLDTTSTECTCHVEAYDVEAVAAQARMRDPQLPYLSTVLTRR